MDDCIDLNERPDVHAALVNILYRNFIMMRSYNHNSPDSALVLSTIGEVLHNIPKFLSQPNSNDGHITRKFSPSYFLISISILNSAIQQCRDGRRDILEHLKMDILREMGRCGFAPPS